MLFSSHTPILRLVAASVIAIYGPSMDADEPVTARSLPERWIYTPEHSQPSPPDDEWWRAFNDPLLDSLIASASRDNPDVSIAMRRIQGAEAAVSRAKASYFPTIVLTAGYTLDRQSGNLGRTPIPAESSRFMSLGANASWEVDLFGRISASVRQQKEMAKVSKADYDGTLVSLTASLATAYINLRMAQQQLAIVETHLKSQERAFEIARARHEATLVSELDEAQAATVCATTRATLPSLRRSIAAGINSIAILLGRYPSEVESLLANASPLPVYSGMVSTSIPGELLRRRPDIVAAEATVASQAAALGVAKKDFLPTLAIQGSFSIESHDPSRLFEKRSIAYSVVPTLSWTLFDGFGRRAAVKEARASLEVSVEQYRQTVLNAVSEVEDALSAYIYARQYSMDLADAAASAAREVELSLVQYRSGLTLFTPVSQALTTYLQLDSELVAAQASESTALINLYRALGGGYITQ